MPLDREYFVSHLKSFTNDLEEFLKKDPNKLQDEIDRLKRGLEHNEQMSWRERREKEAEYAVLIFMGSCIEHIIVQLEKMAKIEEKEQVIKDLKSVMELRFFKPIPRHLYDVIRDRVDAEFGFEEDGDGEGDAIMQHYIDTAKELKRIKGDSIVLDDQK